MKGSSYFLEWGDYKTVVNLCKCGADISEPRAAQCKACAARRQAEEADRRYQEIKLEHHRAYRKRLEVRTLIHEWWVSTS